jgi:hypothetical protein
MHVTVTREFDVPDTDTGDTLGGVDERSVALTALARDTLRTWGSCPTTDESNRNASATTRCQKHGATSINRRPDDRERRLTEWVIHRLSRAVVAFAEQLPNPATAFEDVGGVREETQHGP